MELLVEHLPMLMTLGSTSRTTEIGARDVDPLCAVVISLQFGLGCERWGTVWPVGHLSLAVGVGVEVERRNQTFGFPFQCWETLSLVSVCDFESALCPTLLDRGWEWGVCAWSPYGRDWMVVG